MSDTPRFGTAGLADSYTVKKFDPAAITAYTAGFGLTAFEYQCGRGVRLAHDKPPPWAPPVQSKISPSRSTRRTISVCRAWRRTSG